MSNEPEIKARPRIQYEVTQARLEEIDKLVATTGHDSRRDLVDEALVLYAWALDATKSGGEIVSKDPKSGATTKFLTKGLSFVERSRRKTT